MREIWIPELLGSLFMLMFLARPLFKGLWPLDGIAWLPLLALGITLIIFPAYGFRPECVPLLLCHGVVTMMNLGPLLTGTRRNTAFHERGILFVVPALGALVLFTGAALWFAPQDPVPARPRLVRVPRNGAAGPAYTLHIFGGGGPEDGEAPARPLIFLVPPGFGGPAAVDRLCAALEDRGFTVISYSRRGPGSPGRFFRVWRAFRRGTVLKKANDSGRALEAERRGEIEFLVPYVKENLAALAPGADGARLFLAGWDAGASALVYLAVPGWAGGAGPGNGDPGGAGSAGTAAGRFPGARPAAARSIPPAYGALGLVALEGRLWSSWVPAPPPLPAAGSPGPFSAFLGRLRDWSTRFRPERMAGPGEIPQPGIPVLYLVSDQALGGDQAPYAAIFASLRNSALPAALAAMEGTGPLDYSDIPAEYPLWTVLFPGGAKAAPYRPERGGAPGAGFPGGRNPRDSAGNTAALIARFCELIAAQAGAPPPAAPSPAQGPASPSAAQGPEAAPRPRLHLETRYWNFGDLRLY
jgi:hypothetical protein